MDCRDCVERVYREISRRVDFTVVETRRSGSFRRRRRRILTRSESGRRRSRTIVNTTTNIHYCAIDSCSFLFISAVDIVFAPSCACALLLVHSSLRELYPFLLLRRTLFIKLPHAAMRLYSHHCSRHLATCNLIENAFPFLLPAKTQRKCSASSLLVRRRSEDRHRKEKDRKRTKKR